MINLIMKKITWIYNNLDNNEIYDLNKIMALNIKWTKIKTKYNDYTWDS